MSGHRWARRLERAADHVLDQLRRPRPDRRPRRGAASDGRSVWIEPTAPRFTSEAVLAQEEAILTWAMDAQADPPAPSTTVDRDGLDRLQADAAAAVAGDDRLVLVVGPAGAGKTRMLAAAVDDLHRARSRRVRGGADREGGPRPGARDRHRGRHGRQAPPRMAPHRPATAARVPAPGRDDADRRRGRHARPPPPSTSSSRSPTGSGGGSPWSVTPASCKPSAAAACSPSCAPTAASTSSNSIHRFTHPWEAAASLQLRAGDPRGLDAYEAHGRIIAGTLDDHLDRIAATWIDHHARRAQTIADRRLHATTTSTPSTPPSRPPGSTAGHLDPDRVGRDRRRRTRPSSATSSPPAATTAASSPPAGEPVRNRDTVDRHRHPRRRRAHRDPPTADTATSPCRPTTSASTSGSATRPPSTATSPTPSTAGIALASPATTRRGLYVAATRGRDENLICVVTDTDDLAEARDVLEAILAIDRADIPAVTQRRTLAAQHRQRQRTSGADRTPARLDVGSRTGSPTCSPTPDTPSPTPSTPSSRTRVERARRAAAVTAAERDLAVVDRATAPHREMLAIDAKRADAGPPTPRRAQRRLAGSGRRGRREARRELDIAEQVLDRATAILERTRQRTAPDVERYRAARHQRRRGPHRPPSPRPGHPARPRRPSAPRPGADRGRPRHVAAVGQRRHHHRRATPRHRRDPDRRRTEPSSEQHRALGHAIQTWADTAGLDLHIADRRPPTLEHTGPEFGPQPTCSAPGRRHQLVPTDRRPHGRDVRCTT